MAVEIDKKIGQWQGKTRVTVFNIIVHDHLLCVEDIINQSIEELHGETQERLDKVIDEQKILKAQRETIEKKKREKIDSIQGIIDNLYQEMLDNPNGIPINKIILAIEGKIPSLSAFTLRFKNMLKEKGSMYILSKKSIHSVQHYYLKEFNKTEKTEEQDDIS